MNELCSPVAAMQPGEIQFHNGGVDRGGEEEGTAGEARQPGPAGERGGRSQQVLMRKEGVKKYK